MKYCEKCGSIMADDDASCGNCGAASHGAEKASSAASSHGEGYPPKYLVQSILVLLFCCIPGGIVALIYGDKVDKLMGENKVDEAWQASKTAKYWLIGSAVAAGAAMLITLLSSVIIALAAASV